MVLMIFPSVADRWPELLTYLLLCCGLIALLVIDLAVRRLPDRIVLPCYLIALLGLSGQAALSAEWGRLVVAVIIGAAVSLAYFVIGLLGNGRLGLGDVKLSGVLGIGLGWLGLPQTVLGVLSGFAVGALISSVLLVIGRSRQSDYPFGPCMIIGAAIGASLGPILW